MSKQRPETDRQRSLLLRKSCCIVLGEHHCCGKVAVKSFQHCCGCCPQVLSPDEQTLAASNDYNFDHPDAFDFDLLTHTLRKLKQGKSVKIPVYDFTTHGRQKEWVRMNAPIQTRGNALCKVMISMSELRHIISVSRLPKRVLISLTIHLESLQICYSRWSLTNYYCDFSQLVFVF